MEWKKFSDDYIGFINRIKEPPTPEISDFVSRFDGNWRHAYADPQWKNVYEYIATKALDRVLLEICKDPAAPKPFRVAVMEDGWADDEVLAAAEEFLDVVDLFDLD